MNCDKSILKELIQTNIILIEEAKESNLQNFNNSKMWIKKSFNNLFNLLPKETLEMDINQLLTISEQEELIKDPQLSIDFFKNKFQREIDDQDWEDEVETHLTPPKKLIPQTRTLQSSNMGFRKKPATNIQSSQKKLLSSAIHNKYKRKII
ncbi:unnamed protein product [Paramecium pentaurelia]|uniref:Uncharacterized protein n=1 Tax=Paramecium pentaurelia TaxID=43138 RepID=A0A8S1SST9_9CILI|nr:unnamed protein product [Paramecium pentaurelia]